LKFWPNPQSAIRNDYSFGFVGAAVI